MNEVIFKMVFFFHEIERRMWISAMRLPRFNWYQPVFFLRFFKKGVASIRSDGRTEETWQIKNMTQKKKRKWLTNARGIISKTLDWEKNDNFFKNQQSIIQEVNKLRVLRAELWQTFQNWIKD